MPEEEKKEIIIPMDDKEFTGGTPGPPTEKEKAKFRVLMELYNVYSEDNPPPHVETEVGDIPSSLSDFEEAAISLPTAGQILIFDGARWKNAAHTSKITWLATPVNKAGLTADGAWHDLDLTADTSANAKGVILWGHVTRGAGSAIRYIWTRKNGSAAASGEGGVGGGGAGTTTGTWDSYGQWHQGCDSGQVIEYNIQTNSVSAFLYVVGYWE